MPESSASGNDSSSETHENSRTKLDVWALGITIVIGGQYFSWNAGLTAGFGSYCIGSVLIGFAYLCLCLCTSELSSALPFAGGAYGLARCTLGFYAGFIIGCCETVEYILYVAASAVTLGSIVASIIPEIADYQPIVWLLFYLSALVIHIYGGINFWRFNLIMALISLFVVILYCLGSLKFVDFSHNAVSSDGAWFVGGFDNFLKELPVAAWFFVGVEALNMACDDVELPRINIPYGQISCVLTLNATAIMVLFVSCSLPGGVDNLASALAPLNTGERAIDYDLVLYTFALL